MPLFDAVATGHSSAMSETACSSYCPPVSSHYRLGPSTGRHLVENTRGYVPQSLRGSGRGLRLWENFGEVMRARSRTAGRGRRPTGGLAAKRDGYFPTKSFRPCGNSSVFARKAFP
jgi:hypothetical protein